MESRTDREVNTLDFGTSWTQKQMINNIANLLPTIFSILNYDVLINILSRCVLGLAWLM